MLPNGHNAVVEIDKLANYCLNPDHPRGRHKAHVFAAAVGFTQDHAEELRQALLLAAHGESAIATEADDFGQRFVIESWLDGPGGRGRLRSCWIVRADEDFPRLTSCYIL